MDQILQILQEEAQMRYEDFVELHRGLLGHVEEILRYAMRQYPHGIYLESADFEKGVFCIHYLTITQGTSVQFPEFPSVHRKSMQLPAELLYRDDWKERYKNWEAARLAREAGA